MVDLGPTNQRREASHGVRWDRRPSAGEPGLHRRRGRTSAPGAPRAHEWFAALLEGRGRMRVVVEASTESEWVAQALEALGHEVIVANFAPMYATRSRRVKTDRRDARTLADACRLGAYRATHRTSAAQRTVLAQLAVREALVRTRTRYLSVIRAVLRREGIRVPSGSAVTFGRRLAQGVRSPTQARVVAPLVELLEPLNAAIAAADAGMARRLAAGPVARRLAK